MSQPHRIAVPLDLLEERVLAEAKRSARDQSAWESILGDMQDANPPAPEPDAARRSTTELRWLIATLGGPKPEGEPTSEVSGFTRAGYRIDGQRGAKEARVVPALATFFASSARDLRTAFPDLWAIDFELWDCLDRAEPRELAILWLTSPGRRLVLDIETLATTQPAGAADFSLERIYRAAGISDAPPFGADDSDVLARWFAQRPLSWSELHAAVPGRPLNSWRPDGDTARALRLLEQRDSDCPAFIRGAALAWLLDTAAKNPIFEVEGLRRDLREDLDVRLAMAFPHKDSWDPGQGCALESLLLQHAARLTASDQKPGAVFRAWGVARWLHGCLLRSPFFGGDAEMLAARLRALLPLESTPEDQSDALAPGRFAEDGSSHDLAELSLLSGLMRHYKREDGQLVYPMPLPLAQALRRVAGRLPRPREMDAERALHENRNELLWSAPHVAAPLAARWLLSDQKIAWLALGPTDARRDSIERFQAAPRRHEWLCLAIHFEAPSLDENTRQQAALAWRVVQGASPGEAPQPHVMALMAAGLIDQLSDQELQVALSLANEAFIDWRPFVLDAFCAASDRVKRPAIREGALRGLESLIAEAGAPDKVRLNAALFAVRRVSAADSPNRNAALERLARLVDRAPFTEHVGLRRELRRLGVLNSSTAGGHR